MIDLLAAVSDLHSGGRTALCPPLVTLDEGGTYQPNEYQSKWLWPNWTLHWRQVGDMRATLKARLIVVIVGDLTDGDHHDTPQIISRNMATQHKIAIANLQPILDLKPDHIFVIRGTETHVGKCGAWEELIAREIGAEPAIKPRIKTDGTILAEGIYSHWWLPLYLNGVMFDIAHHARGSGRPWTRGNPAMMQAAQITMEYAETGDRIPDIAIRAHTHIKADSYDNYPVRVLQLPAWQMPTAYVHRIAPGSFPHCGGVVVECETGEAARVHKLFKRPPRKAPVLL